MVAISPIRSMSRARVRLNYKEITSISVPVRRSGVIVVGTESTESTEAGGSEHGKARKIKKKLRISYVQKQNNPGVMLVNGTEKCAHM